MADIQFFYLEAVPELRNRNSLKKFIAKLARAEKRPITFLSIIFCSDGYLWELNRRFLKHNFYTDIVTFDFDKQSDFVQGELYISVDRVRENAKSMGLSTREELHRVIFHGLLHLCGFDDKLKKHQIIIRSKEDYWLKRYFN